MIKKNQKLLSYAEILLPMQ